MRKNIDISLFKINVVVMAEPLKHTYNKKYIATLCEDITQYYPAFNATQFTKDIFNNQWKQMELKERMGHIATTLHVHLPKDYTVALSILKKAAPAFSGYEAMFFPDYVEKFGLSYFNESVQALEYFTPYASSEFAVRPFILKYQGKMMELFYRWAKSSNVHVRRLSSEGCRPRLPWAMSLPEFKNDPTPILPVLEELKDDESAYVRKSVANNLNDISKNHPQLALTLAKNWNGSSKQTQWIIKHGLRTLLKQGNTEALKLFGFKSPTHIKLAQFKWDKQISLGETLEFSFDLKTSKKQLGKLRIEYAIYFLRKNGEQNKKVFQISEQEINEPYKSFSKKHSFKIISTRKYYPGKQAIGIIINGKEMEKKNFKLMN